LTNSFEAPALLTNGLPYENNVCLTKAYVALVMLLTEDQIDYPRAFGGGFFLLSRWRGEFRYVLGSFLRS
jgi:hypothetical protein